MKFGEAASAGLAWEGTFPVGGVGAIVLMALCLLRGTRVTWVFVLGVQFD